MNRGFTLIETLVYLALFALMMASALTAFYTILESNNRNLTKAMVEQEGGFLVGKVDWVLTGVRTILLPGGGSSGNTLSVTKWDASYGNPIVIKVENDKMTIQRGTSDPQTLHNENVEIVCPPIGCFTHVNASGGSINPESATTTFTVKVRTPDGHVFFRDFSTVKYLRK
jgi:prepilin-type N-terminal cleavage/methylation domain-containing protein